MKITRYPSDNASGSGLLYGAFSDSTSQSPAAINIDVGDLIKAKEIVRKYNDRLL